MTEDLTEDEIDHRGPPLLGLVTDYRSPGPELTHEPNIGWFVEANDEEVNGEAPNHPEHCRYCSAPLLELSTEPWVCAVTEQDVTVRPAFTGWDGARQRTMECCCTPCLLWSRPKTAGRPRKVCEHSECRKRYERDRKRRQRKPRHGGEGSGRPITGDGTHFITGRNSA